jgi:hypothetical protein
MNCYKCTSLFFIIFTITIVNFAYSQNQKHSLYFKRVLISDPPLNEIGDYEPGTALFPDYSEHGLPDDFLVKKVPDCIISPSEIVSIEIVRQAYIPKDVLEFTIKIKFTNPAGKVIFNFTQSNLNEKFAVEINKVIFTIATIMAPIKDEMNITSGDKSKEELIMIFQQISNNVSVKDLAQN